ncbi:SRPBCC domain-containing protein [Conexibacter sp. S30A1]|uniref:SRPBCC family protein n=1 Tax=Conexibacter sp. S30A1 TaxID=2937800 RepID=UPI002010A024|nr:SRPBCC domain-containing protein [Conexibacter sp. S30A1]
MQNFTTEFTVEQTPEQAFAAIVDVRGWWSGEIDGATDQLGAEFTYRYQNIHRSRQRITELAPGRRVVWEVTDAHLDFTDDPSEWVGSKIVFDIASEGDNTVVRFSHVGLTPEIECYEKCSSAWAFYINTSLMRLITVDEGAPNPVERG